MGGFLPPPASSTPAALDFFFSDGPTVVDGEGVYIVYGTIPAGSLAPGVGMVTLYTNGLISLLAAGDVCFCLDLFAPASPPSSFAEVARILPTNPPAFELPVDTLSTINLTTFIYLDGVGDIKFNATGSAQDNNAVIPTFGLIETESTSYPVIVDLTQEFIVRLTIRDFLTFTPPPDFDFYNNATHSYGILS